MRYYKTVDDNFIISVGTGSGGEEITENEYAEILETISNKPTGSEGFDYRLKTDLTWEEYEKTVPEPIDEEAEISDYVNSLSDMGVRFGD